MLADLLGRFQVLTVAPLCLEGTAMASSSAVRQSNKNSASMAWKAQIWKAQWRMSH